MAKATHTGICQICGSKQKLPNGALSLHGYTTEFGFFNGTCSGSKGLPYEESCGLIEASIKEAKQAIIDLTALAEATEKDTKKSWRRSYRRQQDCDYGQLSGYYWIQAEIIAKRSEDNNWANFIWADLDGSDSIRIQREADAGNSIGGDDLLDCIKKHNTAYALQYRKQIDSAKDYIIWQKGRIKHWAPAPLHAI